MLIPDRLCEVCVQKAKLLTQSKFLILKTKTEKKGAIKLSRAEGWIQIVSQLSVLSSLQMTL